MINNKFARSCNHHLSGSLAVPEDDLVDPWEIFNRLSSKSNGELTNLTYYRLHGIE